MKKLRPITNVFIAPIWIRNVFSFFIERTSDPITAAWPVPNPGRNETKGDAINDAEIAFEYCFRFGNRDFIFVIFCCGISCFLFIEVINDEIPKSPVNKGNKGCGEVMLKVIMPKIPAKRNIKSARSFEFFSK